MSAELSRENKHPETPRKYSVSWLGLVFVVPVKEILEVSRMGLIFPVSVEEILKVRWLGLIFRMSVKEI